MLAVLALLVGAGSAAAATYAPLDQPGPPLSVPQSQLDASLYCEPGVRNASVEPVLLNPATGVTATQNYSWNWEPALDQLGIPWCAYTAPYSTLGDIQTSGEYLVHAIRTEYALAGRKIAIMGHSQGGMSMRWALRFWPDTRAMVDKVIGFSGSNHGTTVGGPSICQPDGCPPADWQQFAGSNFINALNSYAETFPGISYTEIYTHTDEVVQPNSGPNASAALHTGGGQITNVATQDICPTDTYEHLAIGTVDPVAYALAVDALTHPGPADPSRIPPSVCLKTYMPGVNPLNAEANLTALEGAPGLISVGATFVAPTATGVQNTSSEPPLACYVFAACTSASSGSSASSSSSSAPTLRVRYKVHNARRRGFKRVRVLVQALEGYQLDPVKGATVTLAGHRARTNAHGVAYLTVKLKPGRRYRLKATLSGCNPGSRVVRLPKGHRRR